MCCDRPTSPSVEFLTRAEITVPGHLPAEDLDRLRAQETERAGELAAQGRLVRAWRPHATATWSNICLWRAEDEQDLWKHLRTLPFFSYMRIMVEQLDEHPNDPGEPGGT